MKITQAEYEQMLKLMNLNPTAILSEAHERRRKALTDVEGPLEPVFYSYQPQSVLVFDDLPALGTKPRTVPLEEFCRAEQFTYAGAPLLHRKRRDVLFGTPSSVILETHALLCWGQGPKSMAVVNLDAPSDKGKTTIKVGKGIFYCPRNNESLPSGTCIGNYPGVLISTAAGAEFHSYGFRTMHDEQPTNLFAQYYATGFYDAEKYGDLLRYIQHAPSEAELANIDMPENLKVLAATANLVPNCGINSPIPTVSMFTLRDINPDEQYFFNYGNYWEDMQRRNQGNGDFALFDMQGEIIGTVNTKKQFTLNEHYQPAGKKPAPRCKENAAEQVIGKIEKQYLNPRYRETFLDNMRFVVNFHANRKKEDGSDYYSAEEMTFIAKMQTISASENPETVLYKIDDEREILSKRDMLTPLSLELCAHMNYYQQQRNMHTSAKAQPKQAPPIKFIETIGKDKINEIYKALQQATPGAKWSIDQQQRFCLVSDQNTLKVMKTYLEKQSIKSVIIEPFPKPPTYVLRVPATELTNKTLKPMAAQASQKSNEQSQKKKK